MVDRHTARRVLVSGRVQGVAFRWATLRQAQRVGALGWVRNLSDGRVEAHVQGTTASVQELLGWLEHGPPAARVTGVVASAAAAEDLDGFEILDTAHA